MKAALFYGKEDIRVEDIEDPHPGPNEIVLKIITCGVCGSDVRMFLHGPSPRYKLPGILGHELCGEIVEVGAHISDYNIGSRVTVAPIIPCMRCTACSRGYDNICEKGDGIGNSQDGGMVEYMKIPEQMVMAGGVVEVPEEISSEAAALSELVGCCLNGINQMGILPGDNILIIGDGPIGLTFLQLLRTFGVHYVATSGRRKPRQELSSELGSDNAFNATETDVKTVLKNSMNHVIVAAPTVEGAEDAFEIVKPGGSILLFSGYLPGSKLSFDINFLHYRQIHIHGSIDCTIKEFRHAVRLQPLLNMNRLVSSRFSIDKTKEAFYASKEADAIKVMIEP
jgi:L-iditol 2-dehydrogenase